jgi:arylsulfatase A-like enzyme
VTDGRVTDAGGAPWPRPNFILVMADDHAAHAIGAYGSRINATLGIDRLAADGPRRLGAAMKEPV